VEAALCSTYLRVPRTWSAHTLPIKDCILFDTLTTTRVLTCSLDRTIVLYDVLQAQVCLRVTLPQSLESLACNATQDLVCAGASNGSIYLVDMTSTAIAVTAAHAHVSHHHLGSGRSAAASSSGTGGALPAGTCVLEGHSKAVSSVRFSSDNSSLVSASADGTVRVWNVWTRQCLREYSPLAKHAISNALVGHDAPNWHVCTVNGPTVLSCLCAHCSLFLCPRR
jgi:WD40 repeat protein